MGCHGVRGVPVNPAFPVISGEQEGYLYLELRDYKLGNRANATMRAVAATLQRQDMLDLAAWFAAQPWPDLRQPRPPADIAHRAETAANSAVCSSCHLEGYVGNSAVPRLAGQEVAYLRDTMVAFRDGKRANNPWMVALLKTYNDADIDALARYLAGM
jgi:cytochrome c553